MRVFINIFFIDLHILNFFPAIDLSIMIVGFLAAYIYIMCVCVYCSYLVVVSIIYQCF